MLYLHDLMTTELATGKSIFPNYEGVIAHTMRLTMPWEWGKFLHHSTRMSYVDGQMSALIRYFLIRIGI